MLISEASWALPSESSMKIQGHLFSYFTNQDLDSESSKIETAIIDVHGSERNAITYFNSMSNVARIKGQLEKTIIIAPHFKLSNDKLLANEYTWTEEGWLSGDSSLIDNKVSSFSIIDSFISKVTDKSKFPHLKSVVITGHSAGGQLTQRYAVGSNEEYNHSEVSFRYIVVNPGSYVYLSHFRPYAVQENCLFNEYKYGLDNLNFYLSQTEKSLMIKNYLRKEVIYLVGAMDVLTKELDQTCPARVQGETRLERAQSFYEMLNKQFSHRHQLYVVPGVGHTQHGMFHSPIGMNVLWQ